MATFFLGQSIGRQTFFGSIDRYNEDNTFQLKFLQYISVKICILALYISAKFFSSIQILGSTVLGGLWALEYLVLGGLWALEWADLGGLWA